MVANIMIFVVVVVVVVVVTPLLLLMSLLFLLLLLSSTSLAITWHPRPHSPKIRNQSGSSLTSCDFLMPPRVRKVRELG